MKRIITVILIIYVSIIAYGQDGFYSKTDDFKKSMSDYLYINQDTLLISHQAWWTRDAVIIQLNEHTFEIDVDGNKMTSSKVLGDPIIVNDSLSYQGYIDSYRANWVLARFTGTNEMIGTFYNYKENMPVVSYDLYANEELNPDQIEQYVLDFLAAHRPDYSPTTIITMDKYVIMEDQTLKAYIKRIVQP